MANKPLDVQIKLENADAMALALAAGFDQRTLQRFTNAAALNAARTLVKPIKSRAPIDTGRMQKAIAARRSKNRGGGAVVGIKGGRTGVWYRWPAVDEARPHVIRARRGGFLSFGGIQVRAVNHPGHRANPFVTEAANAALPGAQEAYIKTVAKLITDQEFRKRVRGLAAKYPRR